MDLRDRRLGKHENRHGEGGCETEPTLFAHFELLSKAV
jgi:hypothetical protein